MGGSESSQGDANRDRAERVLQRQACEGHDARDMNPRWLLGAIRDASPSDVVFAKRQEGRNGALQTMGVAVVKDQPDQSSLEIHGMFGPGMGTELFREVDGRARAVGRRHLVADVVPGARDAYRARGFASAGPVGRDGSYPMSKDVLLPPPGDMATHSSSDGAACWAPCDLQVRATRSLGPPASAPHAVDAMASHRPEQASALASSYARRPPTWSTTAATQPLRTIRTSPTLESRDSPQLAGVGVGCVKKEEAGFFWSWIVHCLERT